MPNISMEEVALELVKIEKEKPTTHDQQKEAIILYELYVKKVYDAFKKCTD